MIRTELVSPFRSVTLPSLPRGVLRRGGTLSVTVWCLPSEKESIYLQFGSYIYQIACRWLKWKVTELFGWPV